MMRHARNILHLHAPASLHKLSAEHVVMPTVYGVGAAMAHHPIGSAAIAVGYLTTAFLAVRAQG
jgi:hypothetical protein